MNSINSYLFGYLLAVIIAQSSLGVPRWHGFSFLIPFELLGAILVWYLSKEDKK